MNMNVNSNSFPINMPGNSISANKLSVKDNSEFMNMLNMIISDKNTVQAPMHSNDLRMNSNVLEIFTGDLTNISQLSGKVTVASDNMLYDKEEKLKEANNFEESVKIHNYPYSNLHIFNPQFQAINTADLNTEYEKVLTPHVNFSSFTNLTNELQENTQNIINNRFPEKPSAENFIRKESSSLSMQAEKLITEIEGQRDRLKNKIDLQVEILTTNRLTQGQNKIISISDESSQIKPQVLSQIKDTIVFMAEEGAEPNTVKHVEMELHPESLGKVDIKMTFENNKITVEIKALNEETQKLISSNTDELANILGETTESVNIVVKSNGLYYEHHVYNENQNSQNLNHYNQNSEQGRQKNHYYYQENNEENEDDSVFSQIMNLRSIKLNE